MFAVRVQVRVETGTALYVCVVCEVRACVSVVVCVCACVSVSVYMSTCVYICTSSYHKQNTDSNTQSPHAAILTCLSQMCRVGQNH